MNLNLYDCQWQSYNSTRETESKDLRIYLTFAVKSMRRSFDSLRSLRMTGAVVKAANPDSQLWAILDRAGSGWYNVFIVSSLWSLGFCRGFSEAEECAAGLKAAEKPADYGPLAHAVFL